MMQSMKIAQPSQTRVCPESEIYNAVLTLDGASILELGCGTAELTRQIATGGPGRQLLALEVDEIQHAKNLEINDLPNVRFELGGAQAIPAQDAQFDVVMMFKSLHHVPIDAMAQGLREIHRVLKPGAYVYVSEPVFDGDFNEILRLFHDEQAVRAAAFAAVQEAVASGVFELAEQIFFRTEMRFEDFAEFETKVLGVTHSNFELSAALYEEVRTRFARHMGPEGACFEMPMRVDLLRKPA